MAPPGAPGDATNGSSHDPYAPVAGVRIVLDGAVLRLTLDRPDKRNALDDVMMAGLIDALDAAGRDERVRVVVLAGAGDHFCGGADIVARNAGEADAPRRGSDRSSAGCRRWPTVSCRW